MVSTPYTWGDRNSTTEKLTAAFARLGAVTCVTLLLILDTGEKELLGALQAVSQTVCVKPLYNKRGARNEGRRSGEENQP
jgi:hypothetical protein